MPSLSSWARSLYKLSLGTLAAMETASYRLCHSTSEVSFSPPQEFLKEGTLMRVRGKSRHPRHLFLVSTGDKAGPIVSFLEPAFGDKQRSQDSL